jgi:hypothetical protein
MRWFYSMEKLTQLFCTASLALGMVLVPALVAEAGRPRGRNCCPPSYQQPYCPEYQPYAPGEMAPTEAAPGMPPSEPGAEGEQPTDQQPTAPEAQLDLPQAAPTSAAAPTASVASTSGASAIGRVDQNNRLNLFDSQSAIPRDRVWYSFQFADDYNLSTFADDEEDEPAFTEDDEEVRRADEYLHRFGAELVVCRDFSIAFQGQVTDYPDVDQLETDFSNPQVMLKYVLHEDCCSVYSVVLGATFQTSNEFEAGPAFPADEEDFETVIDEDTSRIFPGFLAYEQWSRDCFLHYGFQFGLPTEEEQIHTFDWLIGTGYWLWRDCGCCHGCGGCGHGCGGCGHGCGGCGCGHGCGYRDTRGLVLQLELLGKHVLGENEIEGPFGLPEDDFVFVEDENVVDLTVGGTVFCGDGVTAAAGFSFPITDDNVREAEFITTLGYLF